MSNTAHQREVADLKAAGLNTKLSALNGAGASTPSSGMGQINAPDYGSSVREGIATALQFRQARANIKNTEAQTNTEIERAEVFKQDRQIKMFTAMIEEAKANTANERQKAELENIKVDTIAKWIGASARQIDAESNRITAEANRTNAETNRTNAGTNKYNAVTQRNQKEVRLPFGIGYKWSGLGRKNKIDNRH